MADPATPTAAPGPHRLFFALWPDDALRRRLADVAARIGAEGAPGGRATQPARYHITVQFLGGFAAYPVDTVAAASRAAASVAFEPFALDIDRLGGFTGSRVWWLGCGRLPGALQRLHDHLARALADEGVAVHAHPGFTPHLTIRRGMRTPAPARAVGPLHWAVDGFVLVDSDPRRGYVPLARWPAGGPGG